MKTLYLNLLFILVVSCQQHFSKENSFVTMCNPINLNYHFVSDGDILRRDAANPCLVLYKDEYYLFMSNGGGYYRSKDMLHWSLISTNLPTEEKAPTVVIIDDCLFFTASGTKSVYKTCHPETGVWEIAYDNLPYQLAEPMLFYDNGKLYLYSGSGNSVPLTGMEIDPHTFLPVGQSIPLIKSCKEKNGWEVAGDYHRWKTLGLWIEGTWMTKYKDKYYLQYASSGIQYTGSNEGVYVSDSPLGPFILAKHNPFAYKPEGFIAGAGNGCVFQDKFGNYWYVGTAVITARCMFERRLSFYPIFFDKDNTLYAYTGMGDYPMILPERKINTPDELFPGWMLLSYNKKTQASSELRGCSSWCAVDETIRTWWSAQSGDKGEYLSIDLGEKCTINAIQINFADQDVDLCIESDSIFYQYYLEESEDGKEWHTFMDKPTRTQRTPHDYIQLDSPLYSRFFRITNVCCSSGKFSVSGFRIFGSSEKTSPKEAEFFRAIRNERDRRDVTLKWTAVEGALGYNIRYGTHPDKLYHNYMVYDDTELMIGSLQTEQTYYFAIDSFNEGGITCGRKVERCL